MATSTGGENDAPLVAVLVELRHAQENLERLEYEVVRLCREIGGATWEDVGELLGISRQAARERFSKPKPRRRAGP
jgi:hypothetical protein